MNVKRLKEILNIYTEAQPNYFDNCSVVVPIAKPSIGGIACVEVVNASKGIDWDSGKFKMLVKERLVIKSVNEEAFDMARELLMWLATKPSKKLGYEQRQAMDILDRLGIEYEEYADLYHREGK